MKEAIFSVLFLSANLKDIDLNTNARFSARELIRLFQIWYRMTQKWEGIEHASTSTKEHGWMEYYIAVDPYIANLPWLNPRNYESETGPVAAYIAGEILLRHFDDFFVGENLSIKDVQNAFQNCIQEVNRYHDWTYSMRGIRNQLENFSSDIFNEGEVSLKRNEVFMRLHHFVLISNEGLSSLYSDQRASSPNM